MKLNTYSSERLHRAVTLFDYPDCKGHSVALFESDIDGTKGTVKTYDNAALKYARNEEVETDSVMVPAGLELTIQMSHSYEDTYWTTSTSPGTKEPECQNLPKAGNDMMKWQVLVTRID